MGKSNLLAWIGCGKVYYEWLISDYTVVRCRSVCIEFCGRRWTSLLDFIVRLDDILCLWSTGYELRVLICRATKFNKRIVKWIVSRFVNGMSLVFFCSQTYYTWYIVYRILLLYFAKRLIALYGYLSYRSIIYYKMNVMLFRTMFFKWIYVLYVKKTFLISVHSIWIAF